jgi:hypothetical protein
VRFSRLGFAVLRRGLPDTFLECRVKRRIGIKANRERDVQDGMALTISLGQQLPGMRNPVLVQVVKKTDAETGINYLGQMIN